LIRLAILVSYGGAGVKVCRDCAECSGVLYVGIGDSGLVEEAEFFQLSEGCSSAVLELVRELEIDIVVGALAPSVAEVLVEEEVAVMTPTFTDPRDLVRAYVSGELADPLAEAGFWLSRPNN